MKTRSTVVEGRFYPSTKNRIFDQIMAIEQTGRYPEPELSPSKVFGAVLPHAGHLYSGYQTIPFFQLIRRHRLYPDTFVIIHPNHTGQGSALAIDESELWVNSIGEVPVDTELAKYMKLPFDHRAHAGEHSAEVIVPFMQYYLSDHPFSIVPLCMLEQSYENAKLISERLIRAVKKTKRNIMLIASCDFSHFVSPSEGARMDQMVIDHIIQKNVQEVEREVIKNRISVCGFGPIMALMEYARLKFADYKIEILARGHSGEVVPNQEVVDYISLIAYQ